jgi:hypothetical protein
MGLVDDEPENHHDELEETAFSEVKVVFFVEMLLAESNRIKSLYRICN